MFSLWNIGPPTHSANHFFLYSRFYLTLIVTHGVRWSWTFTSHLQNHPLCKINLTCTHVCILLNAKLYAKHLIWRNSSPLFSCGEISYLHDPFMLLFIYFYLLSIYYFNAFDDLFIVYHFYVNIVEPWLMG